MCDRMLQDSLRCYRGARVRGGDSGSGAWCGFGPGARGGDSGWGFGVGIRARRGVEWGFGPPGAGWGGDSGPARGGVGIRAPARGVVGIQAPDAGCAGIQARARGGNFLG